MFVSFFVAQCVAAFLVCNHLDGEERAGCFTLFVFLVSCDCYCSLALPDDAMGLSTICDFGIS